MRFYRIKGREAKIVEQSFLGTSVVTMRLRYLYSDPPVASVHRPRTSSGYASQLRTELNYRGVKWAMDHSLSFEQSLGEQAVVFREGSDGTHGNFLSDSYQCLRDRPDWARRLNKVHTSSRRAFLSRDNNYKELDACTSSDALLMNVFCHPETLGRMQVRSLMGIDVGDEITFGFKPGIPFSSGRSDNTEIDLRIGNLFVEAKLTEYDFQTAPLRLLQRYRDLTEVFALEELDIAGDTVESYQLIRGALAAFATPSARFCVLCDARRPDLISRWYKIMRAVKASDLRTRLLLLTWQELALALTPCLRDFLMEKYGIG